MSEQAIRFGPSGDLMGIVAPGNGAGASSIGCLLFNAGIIHRTGPHRINVRLARALSAAGIPSLRMDLSGLGDSAASRVSLGVKAQAIRDLQDGIGALQAVAGVDEVIVVGICSGAVSAYDVAQVDDRVHGLLMFDGYMFPTWLTHVIRRWRRLLAAPMRVITGRLRRVVSNNADDDALSEMIGTTPSDQRPTRAQFAAALDLLVRRGVAVNIINSGSFIEQHNYARQFDHAFANAAFLKHIRHSYLPSLDHTLTPLAAQRTLVSEVVGWASDTAKKLHSRRREAAS